MAKITLIQSYALSNNTDIIFLSETFLDSTIEASDPDIDISGYNSFRSDHPSNTKRGGVCMFYKDYLHVITYLLVPTVTEIKLAKIPTFFYLQL